MTMKRRQVTDKDGNRYRGEMSGGMRHGFGTLIYAETQDVYQGDFENDVPHGAGKYIRSGGDKNGTFEGLWVDGKVDQVKKGRAKIVEDNGDVYDGGFHHWKRHGQGVLRKKNGEVYKGQFRDWKPNGHGVLRYRNGATYDGFFKDGVCVCVCVFITTVRHHFLFTNLLIQICHEYETGEPDDGSYHKQYQDQPSLYDAKLNSYRGGWNDDKRKSRDRRKDQRKTKEDDDKRESREKKKEQSSPKGAVSLTN